MSKPRAPRGSRWEINSPLVYAPRLSCAVMNVSAAERVARLMIASALLACREFMVVLLSSGDSAEAATAGQGGTDVAGEDLLFGAIGAVGAFLCASEVGSFGDPGRERCAL